MHASRHDSAGRSLLLKGFTQCQTAEELVDKNIQAKGGMEKVKALHSLHMTGKLTGAAASRQR